MAGDSDWVEDVRRWYFNGGQQIGRRASDQPVEVDPSELGYEAAHPSLQARNWPEAPTSGFSNLR